MAGWNRISELSGRPETESDITSLVSDLAAKAADASVVHLAGPEAVTGAKTFTIPIFDKGTGTEVANAVTINKPSGVITTTTLTNAAAASYTITLTNSFISATSVVWARIGSYTGTLDTNGVPMLFAATPGSGTIVLTVFNSHAANALNGTAKIHFAIV